MKKYLLLLLIIPLLVTGCKRIPKLENGQEVVVTIDGKQFTAEEFYTAMKESNGTNILVNMVNEYITSKELTDDMKKDAEKTAKSEKDYYYAMYKNDWDAFLSRYGFRNDEDLLEVLTTNAEQQLIVEKYVKSTLTEEEIKKYYDEKVYGAITARHILIKAETSDTVTEADAKTAALNEAKEIIKTLQASKDLENDFIKLAKEKSDDTGSATNGGLIENFTNKSGLVDEFWNASLKLEVGKFTVEAVETQFGYHIIYKVSQEEKPSLDNVRNTVIDDITNELLSATNATATYWAGLREKYNMDISDDTIKSDYDAAMSQMKKSN